MSEKQTRSKILDEMIKKGDLKTSDINANVNMENIDPFQIILVKPGQISHIPWKSPQYLDILFNMARYEKVETNPEKFIETLAVSLNTDREENGDVTTAVIYESSTHIYEMMYIRYQEFSIPESEIENEFGSLINTKGDNVFGNLLITKTRINENSNSMKFVNMEIDDLYKLFKSRAEHKGVIYEDGEFKEYIWKGEKSNFKDTLDEIFDGEKPEHIEFPFLLHNVNIYYRSLNKDKYDKHVLGRLVEKPIYQCFIMTYLTDNLFSNISLKEVEDIIYLSTVLKIWTPDKELIKDEYDKFNRKIIKNKYRILNRTLEKVKPKENKNLTSI